jgi:hypothetical protein
MRPSGATQAKIRARGTVGVVVFAMPFNQLEQRGLCIVVFVQFDYRADAECGVILYIYDLESVANHAA